MSKYIAGTKIKDLTGQTFGKLTVVAMAEERDKHGHIQWHCKCSCGNLRTVSGNYLHNRYYKSCVSCMDKRRSK